MLVVENLDFEYPGIRALNKVGFTVPTGSITAIVGPNGAGKTTLLRCIAALDEPLSGTITLDNINVREHPRICHRSIGYLSDSFGLYDDLTVGKCLQYTAMAQDIPRDRWSSAVTRAADRAGIGDRIADRTGTLSRGLRQRLAIAQAIIHEPKILLLDEPASGLDPEARSALAALFLDLRDQGMTLLVSSHILAELEEYSTDMLILNNGELVGHRQVRTHRSAATLVRIELAGSSPELAAVLAEIPGVADIRLDGLQGWFRCSSDAGTRRDMLKQLVDRGIPLCAFSEERTDMQSEYLSIVRQARGLGEVRS